MKKYFLIAGILLTFGVVPAEAQTTVLNGIVSSFQSAAASWQSAVLQAATRLFWILATLSLVWKLGMVMLKGGEFGEILAELVRFIICTGFFFWLLTNGPTFAEDIIKSLTQLASQAGGNSANDPSSIVNIGFKLFDTYWAAAGQMGWSQVGPGLCMELTGILILIVFGLIAINMVVLLCSGWLLAYAGIFLLGFGGSHWTSDMAIGYYKTVLNIAIQLFAMILIISCGTQFFNTAADSITSQHATIDGALITLLSAMCLFFLADKLPSLLSGIVAGITHTGNVGSASGSVAGMVASASFATSAVGNVYSEIRRKFQNNDDDDERSDKSQSGSGGGQSQQEKNDAVRRSAFGDGSGGDDWSKHGM